MERDMPELAQNEFHSRVLTVLGTLIEHVVCKCVQVIQSLLFDLIEILEKLLVRKNNVTRLIGVVQTFLMKCWFLINTGIDEPLVCRMNRVVSPSPARCAAAQCISVVSPDGCSYIHEVGYNHVFYDHAKFVHITPPRKVYNQIITQGDMGFMRKADLQQYAEYISRARAVTTDNAYPLSIALGLQTGDIYESDDGKAVLFWHYCGFAYISGDPSDAFLDEVYDLMETGTRRLILITNDDRVIRFMSNYGCKIDHRIEYSYEGSVPVTINTDRFRIVPVDEHNITNIKGRIIPSFSWESDEQFLKNGVGFVAMEDDNICAVAFSSAVSDEEVDIGVETYEEYRRNGLAAALAQKMCEEITADGRRPVWSHAETNIGSGSTALKCGFKKERRVVTCLSGRS